MYANTLLLVVTLVTILPRYGSGQQRDWWSNMQLYQIYPRSFMDSNGDGIGDINGIRNKLDHLSNIGVNATWLSPVFPSPMKDFGYDISDYYNIAPEYGTIADLELLIAEAKVKNIRILMDFVPNHTSDQCEWFQKSIRRELGFENFYVWHDGRNGGLDPPSNWISVFRGPAWTFNEVRRQWYLHQFLSSQPDLNFRDPNVITEMNNVLKFWLNKGVAGFRVDAIPHLVEVDVDSNGNYPDEPLSGITKDSESYDYLNHIYTRERAETYQTVYKWRATLDEVTSSTRSETRILLMEAMSDDDIVMEYYGDNNQEGAHFPFNFNLVFLNHEANANELANRIDSWLDALPDGRVTNWVIGNHDQPRVATRFGPERSDGIVMIAMLLPGVAVTYNGEEIGMTNQYLSWEDTIDPSGCNAGILLFNTTSRDPARTPFQWDSTRNAGFSTTLGKTWLPVADNYLDVNLLKQTQDQRSAYKFYLEMSALRQTDVIKDGDLEIESLNRGEVFAFSRRVRGLDRILVVVNTGKSTLTVDLASSFDDLNTLTVLASSVASTRRRGDTIRSGNFILYPSEALALSKGTLGLASSWIIATSISITSIFIFRLD